MIVFAIIATIIALACTVLVWFANGMKSSPGEFQGTGIIITAWLIVAVFWLAYYVG